MILQEGGRWRSELTALERQMDVDDIVSKLSPEELSALERMLGDFELQGESHVADECANLEWEEVPLPIEEWLESPHHVGETGSTIFPVLKRDLIELFSGGYHEVILCLHPDTRVALASGATPTIRELADKWVANPEPFTVFTYEDGALTTAQAIHPRKTGIDDYYRVTLDDGSSFTGNARHQMLRKNGDKVMIRDMVPGDELLPFEEDRLTNHSRRVASIQQDGNGPVYCMTVPTTGNFAIVTDLSDTDIQRSAGGHTAQVKEAHPTRRLGVISSNTGSI